MNIQKQNIFSPHFLWGAEFFYVYDGDGNIVRSIDISGKKEYNYEYEEGRIVRATEADITLSGEIVTSKVIVNTVNYYYDGELGLYYLQSRYYDACVGRFVNGDEGIMLALDALISPKNPINLYTYCYNNAINLQDQFGYKGFTVYRNWDAVVMITEMIAMTVDFAISAYKLGVATVTSAATGVGALIALFTGLGMAWSIALAIVNAIFLVTAIVLYIKHKKFMAKSIGLFGKGIYLVSKAWKKKFFLLY